MLFTLIGVVALSILISAVCSLLEAVLYSTRFLTLEAASANGDRAARSMIGLKSSVDRPLAAILILNTVANTAGAAVAGWAAAQVWGAGVLWVFSLVFTLCILIFSEILPKTVGAVFWPGLWRHTVLPLKAMVTVLSPIIALTRGMTHMITGVDKKKVPVSEAEILAAAKLGRRGGEITEMEHTLIKNIISLEDIHAEGIMTPRTVMLAVDGGTPLAQAAVQARQWPFSRVPVFGQSADDVVGYVLKYEVLSQAEEHPDKPLRELVKRVHFVPGSANALNLLSSFLHGREHFYMVVDEYGGVMGVITLEDVLESLVGSEIVDESDMIDDMQALARESGKAWMDQGKEADGE